MMWQKNWVHLTSGRSLKVKTCKNNKICFAVLKPNERECLENPWIQRKTCPDPHKTIK
jgi:hypothetical protein